MTDDVIEQAAKVAHDAVCGCGDLRTHNVEDYPINVSFGVVARALAAADLLAAPSAPSVHQRWRDEVRGQIRSAIHAGFCGCRHEHDNPNHTITTGSTDRVAHAVMAIVDPILAERDEARRELAAHVAMHHEHVQRGHQWMRRAETAEAELGAANAKLGPDEPTPSDLQVAPSLGATGSFGVQLMREGIERSQADRRRQCRWWSDGERQCCEWNATDSDYCDHHTTMRIAAFGTRLARWESYGSNGPDTEVSDAQ